MENTTPNGWTSVDTSSDSIAAARAAKLTEKVAYDALNALEIMLDQIRDADEKSLGSLKMAAFMLRMEWMEPTQRALANIK